MRKDTMKSVLLLLLPLSLGQTLPVLAGEAKPTDPAAAAPPVAYRSAFESYRPFREEPIANWRALNAEVGAVGGHMGIMGGAGGHGTGAAKPAAAKPVATEGSQAPVRGAPQAPAGGGHQGH